MSEIAELSRRVAEIVEASGKRAFTISQKCPNGHANVDAYEPWEGPFADIGEPCVECGAPIQPADPYRFAESIDRLLPVVEAWCERKVMRWDAVQMEPGLYSVGVFMPVHRDGEEYAEHAEGATLAEGLSRAFLAAVERWGV